ncbi:thiol-disulfide oxidoreductase ResA [Bacillus paralicheniformis]|uniref:thiol-disulfide oxidoreductase ResA n=1 Tax=Bacillus paralicheniformis TaxID=1648923 RepID=UPI0011A06C2B|nr:thiol-disulfide oxidoreductase ResA [Bacillus paralicheniformis]MDR9799591.1 thiol-disulfide oxidoreductase ResA [Bacillus paralicheniformis]TWK45034.1 Thiol-disulfide oxidoreductase ResA [Bacillus paralicheniformis]
MKKQTLLLLRGAILLLLCCASGYALYQHIAGGRNEQAGTALHQQALHFKLSTLEGGDIELKKLRGKAVVVNFWGTFCTPCQEEMPVMQKAYDRFKGDGFEIIAVYVRESKGAVKSFVDRHGLTFPVALDQSAEGYRSWEIYYLPTSIFINREGRPERMYVGGMSERKVDMWIEDLLSGS